MFSNILPAHIVKDVPGGFAAGLARALPVTGGQFRVESIDPQRDEILLARNDRYWGPPAKPALILFRRAGAPAALADSIRNGDTQVAQVHGGSAAFAQLSAIPDVRTARIVTPRVMQLTLRANEPKLADTQVRKAILGLLDVDLLAAVGAGSDNTVTLAQAQIRVAERPRLRADRAAGDDEAGGAGAAGRRRLPGREQRSASPAAATADTPARRPRRSSAAGSARTAKQLSLVIGVAANDPTSVAVANTAADQLRNVGIAATVLALDPVTLYRDALNDNRVDAIVGWHQAGGNLATLLASRYGCPALESTAVPTSNGAGAHDRRPPPATPSTGPAPTSTTPTTTAAQPSGRARRAGAGAVNLTGICDRSIQSNIDAALDGTKNINDVITAVEPRLWNMSTVLPILQDTTIVAAGPERAERQLVRRGAGRHRRRRRPMDQDGAVTRFVSRRPALAAAGSRCRRSAPARAGSVATRSAGSAG